MQRFGSIRGLPCACPAGRHATQGVEFVRCSLRVQPLHAATVARARGCQRGAHAALTIFALEGNGLL